MRVSVLSHDLSGNCLGRAHLLARLLAYRHDVEIVGPVRGAGIWPPLDGERTIPIRPLPTRPLAAARAVRGDVLYAVKPQPMSLGVALLAARLRDRPVLADVDDSELGFFLDNPRWLVRNLLAVHDPANAYATWATGRLVGRAAAVTVASTGLRRRFGGTLVPHARDPAALDPARADGAAVRAAYGLVGCRTVAFVGSPRRHKGLVETVAALDRLGDPAVRFLVVGADGPLPARDWLVAVPPQPFDRLADLLAAADVVVLAQQPTRVGRVQLPAKLVDAMAMGRPVVGTAVSDLPLWLDGCGLVVPPGDTDALAAAVGRLLGDRELAERLGRAARDRFLAELSDDAVRGRVQAVVEGAVAEVPA